jgi:hypothetical protein
MVTSRPPAEEHPHGLDDERIEEVRRFCDQDPTVRRLLLVFDALRLRGVDRTQAARTAHLVTTSSTPSDDGPMPAKDAE